MKKQILMPAAAIILAAALLFGVSAALSGVRAQKAQQEHVRIMRTLLPGSEQFVREAYAGEDENIRSVHRGENGYVIETVCAGYAGDITMMIGVSDEGSVTGLVVRQMEETWTLGSGAVYDHVFLAQLLDTSGEAEVGENVDALTGATVTSKAVVRAVNSAVAFVTGADVSTEATSWGG